MAKEICQDCEKIFEGGPHAFLCEKCRKKRIIFKDTGGRR